MRPVKFVGALICMLAAAGAIAADHVVSPMGGQFRDCHNLRDSKRAHFLSSGDDLLLSVASESVQNRRISQLSSATKPPGVEPGGFAVIAFAQIPAPVSSGVVGAASAGESHLRT
jgi:hypothetical protein